MPWVQHWEFWVPVGLLALAAIALPRTVKGKTAALQALSAALALVFFLPWVLGSCG